MLGSGQLGLLNAPFRFEANLEFPAGIEKLVTGRFALTDADVAFKALSQGGSQSGKPQIKLMVCS